MPVVVPYRYDLPEVMQADGVNRTYPLRNGASVSLPEDLTYVFIVFTHRVGSFYLADLLTTTGFFNQAQEAITTEAVLNGCPQYGLASFSEYFAKIAQQEARHGYFLVKSSIAQLANLAWHGVLDRILPASRFIVLERMDKVAQVVSWSIADQTGRYHADAAQNAITPIYDGRDLQWRLERVVQEVAQAALFMAVNGLVPMHLSYERLISNPLIMSRMVCRFLDKPELVCDPRLVPLRRQATELNQAWRTRFLQEQSRWTGPAG